MVLYSLTTLSPLHRLHMPSASSPTAYPLSSSPVQDRMWPSKTAKHQKARAVSGFILDEDSDSDGNSSLVEPSPKRMGSHRLDAVGHEHAEIRQDPTTIPEKGTRGFSIGDQESNNMRNIYTEEGQFAASPKGKVNSVDEEMPLAQILSLPQDKRSNSAQIQTCSGKFISIQLKKRAAPISFESLAAARSKTKSGCAKKSYYGVDIHQLIEDSTNMVGLERERETNISDQAIPSVERVAIKSSSCRTVLWTEKYRARSFMELCGDDRTHRQVLRWLKAWDPIVFPNSGRAKPRSTKYQEGEVDGERCHRKILLLAGPPGLGKTTLAHVCARQAGYEVMEINASDERSRDVVKGRIRTSVGTESVKTGSTVTSKTGRVQKVAHPLCVVVDEVDGVVGGSGGSGEGGFIKALIDLIHLDQRNSSVVGNNTAHANKNKKKTDDFRLLRPLILICNDIYHPSLRPLRYAGIAEVIHIRKPPIDAVVARMKCVFEKEGISCDSDAVRRLCEASWGVNAAESRKGLEGSGEGDLRGIMVVGEWAAGRLKAAKNHAPIKLTRDWVDQHMMDDLLHGGGGARGSGRGGIKDIVNRVFLEGAGFPKSSQFHPPRSAPESEPILQLGVAGLGKKPAMDRLREMVDTNGDTNRIISDIFTAYPQQPFNDDSTLSKPDAAYEWLHFHDACSSRVFTGQEWELMPYLTQSILAWHLLFSSPARHHFSGGSETKKWGEEEASVPLPFSGQGADYLAYETAKSNRATILELQGKLNAMLLRSFRSAEDIATELLPYLVRLLTPGIKPIVVGGSGDQRGVASVRKGSEKAMVKRAVDVMSGVGVQFERGKLENDFGNRGSSWVYRMEPALDTLVTFETAAASASATSLARYAVRQVLDQEYEKHAIVRENAARQARYRAGSTQEEREYPLSETTGNAVVQAQAKTGTFAAKRDFFGRVVGDDRIPLRDVDGNAETDIKHKRRRKENSNEDKVWVSYHEGYSNAVRKPITLEALLRGL